MRQGTSKKTEATPGISSKDCKHRELIKRLYKVKRKTGVGEVSDRQKGRMLMLFGLDFIYLLPDAAFLEMLESQFWYH